MFWVRSTGIMWYMCRLLSLSLYIYIYVYIYIYIYCYSLLTLLKKLPMLRRSPPSKNWRELLTNRKEKLKMRGKVWGTEKDLKRTGKVCCTAFVLCHRLGRAAEEAENISWPSSPTVAADCTACLQGGASVRKRSLRGRRRGGGEERRKVTKENLTAATLTVGNKTTWKIDNYWEKIIFIGYTFLKKWSRLIS